MPVLEWAAYLTPEEMTDFIGDVRDAVAASTDTDEAYVALAAVMDRWHLVASPRLRD